jgi:hypothetical protein
VARGKGINLLKKTSKRKRTKKEMNEIREEENLFKKNK